MDAVFQMNKHKCCQQGLRDGAFTSGQSGFNQAPDVRQSDPCRKHGTSCASPCTGKAGLLLHPADAKDTWGTFLQTLAQLLKLTPNVQKRDTLHKSLFPEQRQKFSWDFTKTKISRVCLVRAEAGSSDGDHLLQCSVSLLYYITFQSFRMFLYIILNACQIQREA